MTSRKSKEAKGHSAQIDAVKAYEDSLKSSAPQTEPAKKIDFDQWWAIRSKDLGQPAHVKEIMLADAKARGLREPETLDRWDWAAHTYGLKF